jgi:hypothetical protein
MYSYISFMFFIACALNEGLGILTKSVKVQLASICIILFDIPVNEKYIVKIV